ncbi:peptide deformylase [Bacillus sp. Marseille-P3661]|uniref:peptide deformylase n=1 Tax=Bacillus sp. Marseille-P3661 TaxID=1936234 RepID=UPI000C85A433|nr:peptide deformylase [Bacillus sp. Marseille-P3661]
MSRLEIVKYPAEVLTTRCALVQTFDKQLSSFINDMFETMEQADGVGLAAPQVNESKQIAVVDIGDGSGRFVFINPVIIEERGEQVGPEGCLSFPGLFGEVKRSEYVKVRAQNRKGKTFVLEAEGFFARAIQHEIDHLHGILFTEKVIRYYQDDELQS